MKSLGRIGALVLAFVGLSACGARALVDDLTGAAGTSGTVTDAGRATDAASGQCSTTNAPPGPLLSPCVSKPVSECSLRTAERGSNVHRPSDS